VFPVPIHYNSPTMIRRFLAASALISLFLPTLCLAGVFGHACGDCEEGPACGHEEQCLDDPCSETAVRPAAGTLIKDLLPIPSCSAPPVPVPFVATTVDRPSPAPPPRAKLLPFHESDLPLLI